MKVNWKVWLLASLVLTAAMRPEPVQAETPTDTATAQGPIRFNDIGQVDPDKQKAIQEAVRLGLINGFSDDEFRPQDQLSRAQLAVLLAKALNLDVANPRASSFSDVPQDHWGTKYIEAVKTAGLMSGDNGFRPGDPISREELAAVFVRAVHGQNTKGGHTVQLTDLEKVSGWAENAVQTAVRLGLMDSADSSFRPATQVQRQDIAQFLIDIFPEKEQRAVVTKVEGDVITINDTPMLVTEPLKALLLNGSNVQALQGAVLKFKSAVRSVKDLSGVEIVRGGKDGAPVTLDTTGMPKEASLRIDADHVALQGGQVTKVVLGEQAGHVTIDAPIGKVEIDGSKPVTLKGGASLGEISITKPTAKVELGQGIKIDKLVLPENVKPADVIPNLSQLQQPIKTIVTEKGGPVQTPITSAPAPAPVASSGSESQANQAPVVANAITDRTATAADAPFTVDLSNVFTDANGDALTLSVLSSTPGVAGVSVTGTTLTVTPVNAGTTTVTVTADDGRGGTKSDSFTVTISAVMPLNQAPVVANAITDRTATAADAPFTVDLSNVFTDADGDALTLGAVSSTPGVATASVTGATLTITPVNAGTTTVTVTADDGNGGTKSDSFTVTISAVMPLNQAPVVANAITDRTATAADAPFTVDLSNVFTDADGDALTLSVLSSTPGVATASITGATLTITPVNAGNTTVTVTADDGRGGTKSDSFTVTISAVIPLNQAPVVTNAITDRTATTADAPFTVDLSNVFTDADGDALTLGAVSSTPGVATASVTGATLTITPVNAGTTTVTVTADDGNGGTQSDAFSVTISAVNQAPVVANAITDRTATAADAPFTVDLSNVFTDADGDALTLSALSSTPGVATVSVTGATLTITPVNAGTTTVTVTANDGNGGTQSDAFTVTISAVTPPNQAPTVSSTISNQNYTLGDSTSPISLTGIFSDADNDMLSINANSTDNGIATVMIMGNDLLITPVTAGMTTITVIADDGKGGTVNTNFTVQVNQPAAPGLFISETFWGSADLALEIFNPSGSAVDLSKLKLVVGSTEINLSSSSVHTLGAGSVLAVLDNMFMYMDDNDIPSSFLRVTFGIDPENGPSDVSVKLKYDGQIIDSILYKKAKTMARHSGIQQGSSSPDSSQWTEYPVDTFGDLGYYIP
ncbi:Ig-like domain-containing protein [Gorillibacterium sp. sgz5001074]|uniref:Ig-like domain-containing protein n=1 Tax=Gorillibacterium sp. sgz5001074 TaxID=3446695 RepID=UPI003F67A41D